MLREIHPVQTRRGIRRRWFSDAEMDLFVWLDHQMPLRFQLSYNKQRDEHALSWDRDRGFSHHRVDDGEHRVSEYKMSPLLAPASATPATDMNHLASRFLRASENIEPMLADFIYARLLEYPQWHRPHANPHTAATEE